MDVKKQKVPEGVYKRRRVDRISKLPDTLLHHVLSFLPIREVVTTSILSTRWRYLWTCIPVLQFKYPRSDLQNPTCVRKFINFVDGFLLLHNMNIQKFCLVSNDEIDESIVNRWISHVIRHKVQELCLDMDVKLSYSFAPDLLTCESLVKLTIHGYCIFKLPMRTCFPRLKNLCLFSFEFSVDHSTEKLFSNFPVLEELAFYQCRWEDIEIFYISAPVLKRLIFCGFEGGEDDGLSDCVLNINAPNLLCLHYSCCLPKDFIQCNSSSFICADICVATNSFLERSPTELVFGVIKLLGRFSNVKLLRISGGTFEILSNAKDLLTHLPPFHNLIILEVISEIRYSDGRALLDLLQISPKLLALNIFGGIDAADEEYWIIEKLPQCLLLHLREVKFQGLVGDELEFSILEFLLRNALVLERMTLSYYLPLTNLKKRLDIAKKLLMLPRGSTKSVIQFS